MKKLVRTIGLFLAAIVIIGIGQTVGVVATSNIPGMTGDSLFGAVYAVAGGALSVAFMKVVLKTAPKDFGLTLGNSKIWQYMVLLLVPVLVITMFLLTIKGRWVGYGSVDNSARLLAVSLFAVGIPAGIVEEFVFRGILLKQVTKSYGLAAGIILPSVVFAALHIVGRNLDAQSMGQLMIAGTLAGIMFASIATVTRSIWPGVFLHAIWNAIMIGELLHFAAMPSKTGITYVFNHATSTILSGGQFGIESSLVAIIVYGLVIFGCRKLAKRQEVTL